ncbi:hypothetical protein [Corynebacterium aquilae]|uniref:Membrane protein n=1 Tax=Corynebacterium aquilae DSM 44791 TaxID=1431546 RepID=A0A1L7CFF1_9CORY|nr:hypothetical protein [Corynebacterium aquilae]APT84555.1 membrane protein [Corynebacterium aquilae DSM 44791]
MTSSATSTVEYSDDQTAPIRAGIKVGALSVAVITVVALVLFGVLFGLPGVWGALIGAAIGGGFVALTAVSVLVTARTSPSTTGAVVLGGWLLKIVILLIVLFAIRDLYFYNHVALFVTAVAALLAMLGSEVFGVMKSRTTYIGG